jgi:hypothetical protein
MPLEALIARANVLNLNPINPLKTLAGGLDPLTGGIEIWFNLVKMDRFREITKIKFPALINFVKVIPISSIK